MESTTSEAPFTFSWLALKLLGRGLYSNPWSALSELVANGLDAGANQVYVHIDARDKAKAVVEVIDNGSGMSSEDISNYVKVGFNKREHALLTGAPGAGQVKGRKGIGKLAALFLSRHFYLQTRHKRDSTNWELDARDGNVKDDEYPRLKKPKSVPRTANDALWTGFETGTRIILQEVDLTGYGPQSITALGSRLANQFLLQKNTKPEVLLWVRTSSIDSTPNYEPVEKSIAFGNLATVAMSFGTSEAPPPELLAGRVTMRVPARDLPNGGYSRQQLITEFPADAPDDEAWDSISDLVDRDNQTYQGVKYQLSGWIGVHATINSSDAKQNDHRFVKNKYYNPAQIRVYVRGKLASDRLLSQLGLTGTYVNYVEGEITFDLLDEDSLPDIATSNRQDFDETDGRITLLRALVRPIVRSLISSRAALAAEMSDHVKTVRDRKNGLAKQDFSDQLKKDLDQHPEIPESTRDELRLVITSKVQGDTSLKTDYRVFISHASADKAFVRFIDDLLQVRGAKAEEIFFTSRAGNVDQSLEDNALESIIRESITSSNTLIFYMTSKHFLKSQYCLFEGGAGWATRGVSEFLKLNMDYDSIPKFLTNGKQEITMIDAENAIVLTHTLHTYLIRGILNPMIEHLNRGRKIAGEELIQLFNEPNIPTAVQMKRSGTTAEDYFDKTIVEHWNAHVKQEVPRYLSAY